MSNFRAFVANGAPPGAAFYFIESTAPDDVEGDPGGQSPTPPPSLLVVDPDQAVKDIAAFLTPAEEPQIDASLVVMVHGFNTPRPRVLELYDKVRAAVVGDGQIFDLAKRRIVCIGYRWPSESIFGDLKGTIDATPNAALVALALVCAVVAVLAIADGVAAIEHFLSLGSIEAIACLAAFLTILIAGVFITAAALRAIVYFRDVYRATNNGVPDLVEVIRQIDLEAVKELRARGESCERKRIALSFIGHSMGGLVVVSAIRVLSDVFDPGAILTKLSGAARSRTVGEPTDDQVSGRIGHVFDLMHFVLASPDIPGETLLANRANFLASSLRRFKEAYLFSSEGDGVLRSISTIVNYFTFPTSSRNYGYRLGNAEILTSDFTKPVVGDVLKLVRVGLKTLGDLPTDTADGNPSEVANAFTFFDCTDYKDGEPTRGMLTEARNYKRNDQNAHIPVPEHIKLLFLYVLGRKNIHGGYFDGAVTQKLIYRLACLGFTGSAEAYGSKASLLDKCAQHQIRVLPSKRLSENARRRPERMDISPASYAAENQHHVANNPN